MDLDPVFDDAGRSWNVDPDLLRAVAGQESGGNDRAVSPKGAQGRMQIMPDTGRQLGMTDPYDPVQSIYAGAKYLSQALDAEKGNPQLALLYYHGGPDWRNKWGPESAGYVPSVAAHYQAIQAAKAKQQDGGAAVAKPAPAANGGDDDEDAGKALIQQLTAGAGGKTPGAAPGGKATTPPPAAAPAAAPAPANDDDAAAGEALIKQMTAGAAAPPATTTTTTPSGGPDARGIDVTKMFGPPDYAGAVDRANKYLAPVTSAVSSAAQAVDRYLNDPNAVPAGVTAPGGGLFPQPVTLHDFARDVWNTIKGGYGGDNPLQSKDLQTVLAGQGAPGQNVSSALDLGGSVLRGGNALAHGGMAALADLFGGGQLGRDIVLGSQVAPVVLHAPGSPILPDRAGMQAAAETRAYGAPVADLYARNRPQPAPGPVIEGKATAIPAGGPQPGMGRAQPAGAAEEAAGTAASGWRRRAPDEAVAPRQEVTTDSHGNEWVRDTSAGARDISGSVEAKMTPDEILAHRHDAEQDWLNRTNQPGVQDNRVLVEGNNPTLAQREQNAATSREQKLLAGQNPELSQEEQALLDEHNLNRQNAYRKPELAGSDVLANNAEKTAKDKLDAGLNAAFANKTAADAQPVVAAIDKLLSGRSGKRQAIETEVNGVRSRLFDKGGNLETDPEILYGVREHINDVLSKENQRQNPVSARAQSELIQLRDNLDGVIDKAAPGFTKAIKGYAEDMKQPDVMRALLERYDGLHDSKGRMQFSKFHSLMRDIIDARQRGAALSPFQHLTDDQMLRLQYLHDDLKRAATADDLARAKGSDTAQNLWDAGRAYLKGRGIAAVNAVPYVGGLVRHAQEAYAPFAEAKAQQKAMQRGIEMLRPPENKYPTRNPLAD